MIYWIFTTIVKPIITYAALAWWTKVKQKRAEITLGKLHRLVCGSITGAMKTCPTSALGVITGIPPLPILIQKEACASALRLPDVINKKSGDFKGHLSVLNAILDDPIIKIPEYIQPKISLVKNFNIIIPKREDWYQTLESIGENGQVWYTDGSKLDDGSTGAGIMGPRFQKALPMGKYPSVFQAELYAIEICVRECLRRKTIRTAIHIMSDSQAALQALRSTKVRSGLIDNCLTLLNELGQKNKLTLYWIPGHEGYEGNERADCLAKRGAQRKFIGPEPFCTLSVGHRMDILRKWEETQFKNHWMNSKGQRQAKRLITISSTISKKLLGLNRDDLRLLTNYLTGHCKLRYHLHKMGLTDTTLCRFCQTDAETSEHILCDCPALGRTRKIHIGETFIAPENIWNTKSSKVLNFIKSLKMD